MTAFEQALGVMSPPTRATLQVEIRARYGAARVRPGDVVEIATSITEYTEREGTIAH